MHIMGIYLLTWCFIVLLLTIIFYLKVSPLRPLPDAKSILRVYSEYTPLQRKRENPLEYTPRKLSSFLLARPSYASKCCSLRSRILIKTKSILGVYSFGKEYTREDFDQNKEYPPSILFCFPPVWERPKVTKELLQ